MASDEEDPGLIIMYNDNATIHRALAHCRFQVQQGAVHTGEADYQPFHFE